MRERLKRKICRPTTTGSQWSESLVWVICPIRKGKLENQWQGPFIITNKITEVTYQVDLGTSGKRKRTFHITTVQ